MQTSEQANAVEVSGLNFSYGGGTALTIDNFCLERGSACAVIGPSGCGKTTFVHLLAGLLSPTQGAVHILGAALSRMSESERDRFRGRYIGFVFQQFHLMPAISVAQNLLLAQRLSRSCGPLPPVSGLLESLGLESLADRKPRELSHGQAQRVAIARAVCHRPELVIADEPTSALDDRHASDALTLLRQATEQQGAALLVVTHDQRIRGQISAEFALDGSA